MVRLFGFLFLGGSAVCIIVGLLASFCEPLALQDDAFFYLCGGLLFVSGILLLPAIPPAHHKDAEDEVAIEEDGPEEDAPEYEDMLDEDDLDEEPQEELEESMTDPQRSHPSA